MFFVRDPTLLAIQNNKQTSFTSITNLLNKELLKVMANDVFD